MCRRNEYLSDKRMTHAARYLQLTSEVARAIPADDVERLASALVALRERGGRLFMLGVGGSAANASHAVNDFRKLAGIETYAPTDNVPELTARTNDDGWETVFAAYLRTSRATANDAVFVLSVGGGDTTRNVSLNLVRAIEEAGSRGMQVFGIVGRDGGYTRQRGDIVIVVPTIDAGLVTPMTEAFQAVICHALVSHPALQVHATTW